MFNDAGNNTFAIFKNNGKVGIGTTSPQSTLQVNGYLQLSTVDGTPPEQDCDNASEYGRMKVDPTSGAPALYACTADGWIAFSH